MSNFEDNLLQLNRKTLKMDDVLSPIENSKPNKKQIDEIVQLRKQLDQQRLQRERENQTYQQLLQKKDREYEYKLNEAKDKLRKEYEFEIKLLKEDMTYQKHILDQEKNTQIKQLKDEIIVIQDNFESQRQTFIQKMEDHQNQNQILLKQKQNEWEKEKKLLLSEYQNEVNRQEQIHKKEIENWRQRSNVEKDNTVSLLEQQRQNELKTYKDQYDYQIKKISEQSQREVNQVKNEYEQKLKQLHDTLDLEKGNSQLFYRRAQDLKKQYDIDLDCLKKEHQIILSQFEQEIINEKKKREILQKEMDEVKYEISSKEIKIIEDYEQRENLLRNKLQTELNEMYQKQIEIAQMLEGQYKQLDEAAEKKYNKLKQQYEELQQMLQESLDLKQNTNKIRRVKSSCLFNQQIYRIEFKGQNRRKQKW